jgi:hypothetical protein
MPKKLPFQTGVSRNFSLQKLVFDKDLSRTRAGLKFLWCRGVDLQVKNLKLIVRRARQEGGFL